MTSEQRHQAWAQVGVCRRLARSAGFAACLALLGLASCASERFRSPSALASPYPPRMREVVWAVAPLRNESSQPGSAVVDGARIAEALAAHITQTPGVRAVPVSQAIAALREMGLGAFAGETAARSLAEALGADAVVVGAITHYDPYDPPAIGFRLSLYARSEELRTPYRREQEIDPASIMGAISDRTLTFVDASDPSAPLSRAAAHLDGANHAVQLAIRRYANGRFEEGVSPLGWRRFLASMTLFTEFAAHEMAARLLDAERIRVAQQAIAASLEERR